MKKKKTGCRICAALAASIIFLNSITVTAAEPPEEASQPKWSDAFALMEYVGENCYQLEGDNWEWIDKDDVSSELPYYKEGMLLASASKEKTYASFVEETGAFAETNHGEENDALQGNAASQYNDFYAAGVALVDSVKPATGTKYIDDIVGTWNSFWSEKDKPLWKKVESGQIIVVDAAASAPDTASMNPGTYWVLDADLMQYGNIIDDENSVWKAWDADGSWEAHNGGPDIDRSDLQNCISLVTSAYNILLDNLHEGTKGSQASEPETPPTPVVKEEPTTAPTEEEPPAEENAGAPSSTAEESPALVPANEVLFSNGTRRPSTLEGVYGNTFVSGAVYQDEQDRIKQAAGLTNEEIQAGTVIKYYICSSLNKEMNQKMFQDVTAQGYSLLGVMKNDLYRLNHGDIRSIKTTSETLTVVLGIPSHLKNGLYDFVIFCYDENGNLVVLKDTDTDSATITVQARNFGYWAVGYQNKQ